jgi:hypothetical protein
MAEKYTPLETQESVQKSSRMPLLVGALVVLLAVVGMGAYAQYSLYSPCEVDAVQEASALLVSQVKRYDDVYQVATGAFQNSVVLPVTVLQQILMDTKEVAVPACMQTAKNDLIKYMGTVIRAFLAFEAGEPDATVRSLIDESYQHLERFTTELEAVTQCAPFCRP